MKEETEPDWPAQKIKQLDPSVKQEVLECPNPLTPTNYEREN
jgi:hypothetical protein